MLKLYFYREFLNFFLAKPKNAYFLYSQDHKEITEKKYQIWLKLDHKEKEYYLNKEKEEIKFVQLRKQEVLDFLIQNRKFPQFCK